MKRSLRYTVAAWVVVSGTAMQLHGADIVDLVPVIRDNGVLVSFRVEDAFDDDIAHDIETGLPVTFRYNIELKQVRAMWFDEKLSFRRILTTVAYDNLTQRYSLTRAVDGEIDHTEIVADVSAMQRFMTTFDSLKLFDVSRMSGNEDYYLRVSGVMKQGNLLLLIPWDTGTGWHEAHFTYLP